LDRNAADGGADAVFSSAVFLQPRRGGGVLRTLRLPAYVVYPLAVLKLTALAVILANRWRNLKDIAYGAYYLNMIMATAAHLLAGDNPVHAYVGLVAVPLSYVLSNRVRGVPAHDAFLLAPRR